MADYFYWENALKGEFGPVHDGDTQPGFWRKRVSSGGSFLPVAVWEDNGQLVAIVDGRETDSVQELWTFICRYPVTEEAYRERVANGKWPDEDEAMAASLKSPPAYQGMGGNKPPTDPWQVLHDQIETCLKGVQDYGKIDSDETAAKAQGLRSRLLELSGDADKGREKLVRPHLDAEKAVNKIWMPLVKDAKEGANALRAAISAHETRQLQARQAVEAERQRAERQAAKEAEDRRLEAIAAGQPAPEAVMPTAPVAAPVQAPVNTTIRGAYGRAASKTVIKVAKVVDYDRAYLSLRTHPELKALIDQLAQRAAKAGVTVDGVEVEDEIDVR